MDSFRQSKQYTPCREKQYNLLKSLKYEYVPVKSNKQISTLVSYANHKYNLDYYTRLLKILSRYIHVKHPLQYYTFLHKTDTEIYNLMRKDIQKKKENKENKECNSKQRRTQVLRTLFPNLHVHKYLDIGAGDGELTYHVGTSLHAEEIYGIDLQKWYSKEHTQKYPIKFSYIEEQGTYPFENNMFEVVSAFMVLHHVKNLSHTLQEIQRVLKPNGYFILREHDAYNALDYMLIDIEHSMYEMLLRNNPNFQKNYFATYHDILEWNFILSQYHFTPIAFTHHLDSIQYDTEPSRGFLAIYQLMKTTAK